MKNKVYVYLGRFCPFHLGHKSIVDKMVSKFGLENILLIIGSSTSRNPRTPYTFEQRREMINFLYPEIKIIPLPDSEPKLTFFRHDTNEIWLKELEAIENQMDSDFTFVGGGAEDLEVLSRVFETEILVERKNGLDISATSIRNAFDEGDFEKAKNMIDERIFDLALSGYNEFKNLPGNSG